MSAIVLDGTVTRDQIFADLQTRVSALRSTGVTPGLGTVIVGDDPGSHAYVRGKHRDCAAVGIVSIRRDLLATTSQDELFAVIDGLNADPACTGYLVQLLRRQNRRVPGAGPGRGRADDQGDAAGQRRRSR